MKGLDKSPGHSLTFFFFYAFNRAHTVSGKLGAFSCMKNIKATHSFGSRLNLFFFLMEAAFY